MWSGPPGPRRTPSAACWQAGQGAGRERGRPSHIAPQNVGYLSQAHTQFCLLRLLVRVPVLAVERAAHHGEHHLYAALLLVRLQDSDGLGEGVQLDGGRSEEHTSE